MKRTYGWGIVDWFGYVVSDTKTYKYEAQPLVKRWNALNVENGPFTVVRLTYDWPKRKGRKKGRK